MKVKRLDRNWDLLVDFSEGGNLLDIDQAGADPAIADVELDALVEKNSVLNIDRHCQRLFVPFAT